MTCLLITTNRSIFVFITPAVLFLFIGLLFPSRTASAGICEGEWVDRDTIDPTDYYIQTSRVRADPNNIIDSSSKFIESSCPAQVVHYTCLYHANRTQAELLERRQFVPFSLPPLSDISKACAPFRPAEFLEFMRGRNLYFVGDSAMAGTFTTVLCALHTITEMSHLSMNFYQLPGACPKLMCPNGSAHSWNRGGKAYFRMYDFHLHYILEEHLFDEMSKIIKHQNTKSTDIVVYNSGLHYENPDNYELLLKSWTDMMTTLLNLTHAPNMFWMETTPQHYGTSNGYYAKVNAVSEHTCSPIYNPKLPGDLERIRSLDWRNRLAEKHLEPLIQRKKMSIIPIADDLYSQYDAHLVGTSSELQHLVGHGGIDCTHFCFPGNVNRYMVLKMYNVMLRHIQEKENRTIYATLNKQRFAVSNVGAVTAFSTDPYQRYNLHPGDVFRIDGDRSIYMLGIDGTGRPFNSWNDFVGYGYNIKQVKSLSKGGIIGLPLGETLPPPNS